MHDILLMGVVQGLTDLCEDGEHLIPGEQACLVEPLAQRSARGICRGQIGPAVIKAHIHEGEDMGMVEVFKKLSFLNEAVTFSDWQVHMQQFEGNDTIAQVEMLCSVDCAKAARGDLFDETIVADLLASQIIILIHVLSRPFR